MRINLNAWVTCRDCGKRGYHNRKAAKAAARRTNQTRDVRFQMREYRCRSNDDLWHVGHLADPVRGGRVAAADYYPVRSA